MSRTPILPAALVIAVLASISASAQTITIQTPGASDTGAAARISALRVQVQMTLSLPGVASSDLAQQQAATEGGRRAIYEMAARECQVLSEIFKAECRVTSINANSSSQGRHGGAESIQVSGTATYDLTGRLN